MSKKIKPYVIFISLLFSLSYVTASELNPQHTITSDIYFNSSQSSIATCIFSETLFIISGLTIDFVFS
jgi:hypothetical protein